MTTTSYLPLLTAALLTTSLLAQRVETPISSHTDKSDIVDTAVAAGSFKTLAAALKAADLIGTLKGKGPFTVFAPTDTAFGKLSEGTIPNLLKKKNKATLTSVLTYHVVAGRLSAKQVLAKQGLVTLNGQRVGLEMSDSGAKIGGARIVKTDIECSNGVIHVIDAVIMPEQGDIVDVAVQAGSFKTLAAALKAAGLVATMRGEGPFTVFAPTDAAFEKLPKGTVETLLKPENKQKLVDVLTYHVVPGRNFAAQVVASPHLKSVQGAAIQFKVEKGKARANDASIVVTDINAKNGVIHVIDRVITPPRKQH